jgi:hypothetical protein
MEKPAATKTRAKSTKVPAKTAPPKPNRAKKDVETADGSEDKSQVESAEKQVNSEGKKTEKQVNSEGKKSSQTVQSPTDIAMAKYTESDWKVIKPPKGSLNDFVASRGNRFHFVQVVTKVTIDDPKYHGESKNNFVQNAFSNGAVPIFAHVIEGPKPKVTFEDVNTGNRALISTRKKAEEKK